MYGVDYPDEEMVEYVNEGISPIAFYDYWEVGTSPFASGSYTYDKQTSKVRIELGIVKQNMQFIMQLVIK